MSLFLRLSDTETESNRTECWWVSTPDDEGGGGERTHLAGDLDSIGLPSPLRTVVLDPLALGPYSNSLVEPSSLLPRARAGQR